LAILLILSVGMGSCEKDPILMPNADCVCPNFPDEPSPAITWFTNERFQYKAPYFSPNNDEFVYNYFDFELQEFKLMKYNLGTKEKTELSSNARIISQPKWSKAGWIAYDNVFDYQLWVVKDNGDSLMQLTENAHNLFPAWDTTGNSLYFQHSENLGIPYFLFRHVISSMETDTLSRQGDQIDGYTKFNDISTENHLLSEVFFSDDNDQYLAFTDVGNIDFTSIVNLKDEGLTNVTGLTWAADGRSFYFTVYHDGMYQVDINTGEPYKLIDFCDTKMYHHLSASPDGTKLVGERVDRYRVHDEDDRFTGEIVENSSIYLIDLATMVETKIELE
jgi:Tol biopolymer transport system component